MKYKVLHIFSSWTMGGAEKSMLFLADSLEKSGSADNVVGVPKDSFLFKQAAEKELTTVNFKAKGSFDPAGIVRLVKIIKKHKIDIIHAHQGKLYWAALTARIFCPKVKVVLHRRQDTRHNFYSRGHYFLADAVITVSKAVADGLIKYEKVPAEKIKVVYNGVNYERFNQNTDFGGVVKEYNLSGKTVIGTVGAIVDLKGKGQIYLIDAAAKLRNEYHDLRYLIVGSGKGLEELKAYSKDTKTDDIVYFTGYREDVQKYILAMNVFCLLSWDTEGMPNVVIEAQALQKPVIVTNIGGNLEAFIDGKTGVLVKAGDALSAAEAIKKFADNPQLAEKFGEEGRKFVEHKFTIKNMISDTMEVYDKIMAGK